MEGEPNRKIFRSEIQEKDQPGPAVAIVHLNSVESIRAVLKDETFGRFFVKDLGGGVLLAPLVFHQQDHHQVLCL